MTTESFDERTEKVISTLSEHNQKIIRSFVRGKLLAGTKPISIYNTVRILQPFYRYFADKNFDEITAEEIEDWYIWFCKTPQAKGKQMKESSIALTVSYLRPLIVSIHGEEEGARMMHRIKPKQHKTVVVKEEELLTDVEIKRMIDTCTSGRDRAIIAVLYSSGCRVGELCNLKIKDVTLRRESASLHLDGKTGERDIDMFVGVPELKMWVSTHPFRNDPDAYLFVSKIKRGAKFYTSRLGERSIWTLLKRTAERAGIPENKRVNPHSFRHKRATDLADYMTTADLRYMFGWTDMSTTPNIYVHSSRGKVRRKLAEIAGVKVPESVAPTTMVKQCPVCGTLNAATATWCINCTATLSEPLARAEKTAEDWMLKNMQTNQQK